MTKNIRAHKSKRPALSKGSRKFILIVILLTLIMQEILFRICFPLPEIKNFNRINYQILMPTPEKQAFIRNIKMVWKSTPDTEEDFIHDLNMYGFRDRNWKIEKKPGTKRIMFVGDSFVEGMMANKDSLITTGFRKAAMSAGDEVEVMNFGMMGVGLNEYIKLIVDAVPIFKPEHVILVMCFNDIPFQRPYFPSEKLVPEKTDYLTPRVIELFRYYKSGDPIPFRWAFSQKKFFPPVPSQNNPWSYDADTLIKHVEPNIARAMKNGDFNVFRTNWVLQEEQFLRGESNISEKMSMLQKYISVFGGTLTVFYLPSRHQVTTYYYPFEKASCKLFCPEMLDMTGYGYQMHRRTIEGECAKHSIPYFDFTPLFIEEEKKGNHLYWNYDDHIRGSTYYITGTRIFEQFYGKRN